MSVKFYSIMDKIILLSTHLKYLEGSHPEIGTQLGKEVEEVWKSLDKIEHKTYSLLKKKARKVK